MNLGKSFFSISFTSHIKCVFQSPSQEHNQRTSENLPKSNVTHCAVREHINNDVSLTLCVQSLCMISLSSQKHTTLSPPLFPLGELCCPATTIPSQQYALHFLLISLILSIFCLFAALCTQQGKPQEM